MKSKDKSSKQRFGDVNAINHNSYLNIIFIESENLKNLKFGLFRFLKVFCLKKTFKTLFLKKPLQQP